MINIFGVYDLVYNAPHFPPAWLGIMAPYLTTMSCFKHRMDEIRTGVGKFPVGKAQDGKVKMADVGQFGLTPAHHIHLEGITYPPMKRSSIAQSLGPLAQMILLNQSRKNPNYSDKWKRSVSRSLAHLPHTNEIVEHLFNHDATTITPYMSLIGDILIMTGSRASVKAYFPFSVLWVGLNDAARTSLKAPPAAIASGQTATYQRVVMSGWDTFSLSGTGAFAAYNSAAGQDLANINATADTAADIVFHSIWGSHLEDLGVLKFMTGREFSTRQQIGSAFRGKGTCATTLTIKLPKINNYAKLSQALPTDKTTGGQQQIWNRVTFSGKRKAQIGEIFTSYYKKKKPTVSIGQSSSNLFGGLSAWRSQLVSEVRRDGFINQGTVDWRDATKIGEKGDIPVVAGPPDARPRLFMGGAEQIQVAMEEEDI